MKKITIALSLLFSQLFFAQDGVLDTSFGTNGHVLIANSGTGVHQKLEGGKVMYRIGNKIYRLNIDGSLDTTFATNGILTMNQPGTTAYFDFQISDHNIFAFSKHRTGWPEEDIFYMGRYNLNGTLDTTFGAGTGSVIIDMYDTMGGIVPKLNPDQSKLMVAGNTQSNYGSYNNIVARRFNLDGTMDNSFSSSTRYGLNLDSSGQGYATYDGLGNVHFLANGYTVLSVAAAYYRTTGFSGSHSGIVILKPEESTSYVRMNSYESLYSGAKAGVFIDPQDNIYTFTGTSIGYNNAPNPVNIIYKRNSEGNTYNAFGTNGELSITLTIAGAKVDFHTMAIQPDGKILLGGVTTSLNSAYDNDNLVLARFLENGTLDTTFGTNGYVLHDIVHPTSPAGNNTVTGLFLSDDASEVYLTGNNSENAIILKYANGSFAAPTIPAFIQVAPICSGEILSDLPTTSENGVTGTWEPAINNSATTEYTFTPTTGVNAVPAMMTITVNQPTTSTVTEIACDTFTWSANGQTYTTGGMYTNVTTNAAGCSDTATLNLTINRTTSSTATVSVCNSYTWSETGTIYTTSGTYTHTTTNNFGCMSTATLNLTINNAPSVTGSSSQSLTVENWNEATIADLIVSPSNVLWYVSSEDALAVINPLPLETVLTSGNTYYAVSTTTQGCSSAPFPVTVTVSLTLGTGTFDNAKFTIYPNPTSDFIHISYPTAIDNLRVFDLLGQEVITKAINATQGQVDVSTLSAGSYFVKVSVGSLVKTLKIIKK